MTGSRGPDRWSPRDRTGVETARAAVSLVPVPPRTGSSRYRFRGSCTWTCSGRAHPRSVPGRQRSRARVDRARRLDVRDDVHADGPRSSPPPPSRTRLRRPRHRGDGLVNGTVLAEVANQHRGYRIDVTDVLRDGDNQLAVAFRSPVRYANAQSVALGARPRPYPTPFDAIRKSACSFGWDWGIATSTSGIWRPVRLESWSAPASTEVGCTRRRRRGRRRADGRRSRAPRARTPPSTVTVDVASVAERPSSSRAGDERPPSCASNSTDVERWWPAGSRRPAALRRACHAQRRRRGARRGLATRRLPRPALGHEPDAAAPPSSYRQRRAGVRQGRQLDPRRRVPDAGRPARYAAGSSRRRAADLNLIRVWGGGIYEADDFYDAVRRARPADVAGLPVRVRRLRRGGAAALEVEAEAREQHRPGSRHHASLCLLTGNNENLWGYEDWGWKLRLDGKTWGAYYYHELFPGAHRRSSLRTCPTRPAARSAPAGEHPNAERARHDAHLGPLEPAGLAALPRSRPPVRRRVRLAGPAGLVDPQPGHHDDPLTPESPGMIVHQKAIDGNVKLPTGLVRHYRVPEDMGGWHWAMQLNQANAVSCALEWFRSSRRAHRAPWSGSSTTAGRSRPGTAIDSDGGEGCRPSKPRRVSTSSPCQGVGVVDRGPRRARRPAAGR